MIKNDKTDISGVSERLNAYIEGGYKVADAYLLAESYFDIDQWVSAASFYQKVTDACKEKEISGASLNDDEREVLYDSFVLYSICLDNLKDRVMGDEIFCIYALSVDRNRPEAYMGMCRIFDEKRMKKEYHQGFEFESVNWFRLLEYSSMGESADFRIDDRYEGLRRHLEEYRCRDAFTAYKCIAQYMLEDYKTAARTFLSLSKSTSIPGILRDEARRLYNTNTSPSERFMYRMEMELSFKFPFWEYENIKNNWSFNMEDMFVLAITNGKMYGRFIDAYPNDAIRGNNTTLLRDENWRWSGLSIVDEDGERDSWESSGIAHANIELEYLDINMILQKNAKDGIIDYLSIANEETALPIIREINFEETRIRIITVAYQRKDIEGRDSIRSILLSKGFYIVVQGMETIYADIEEDWAVSTDLVDNEYILKMKSDYPENRPDDYFYNKTKVENEKSI